MRVFRATLAVLVALVILARSALAQDVAYIQIEAKPSLAEVQTRLQAYSETLDDVNGFALGAGWYGIALGPYSRNRAEALLIAMSARGLIPRDSYISSPAEYLQQIWPQPGLDVQTSVRTTQAPLTEQSDAPSVPSQRPQSNFGETLAEARASEDLLTRADREELQIALQWAGFYRSSIDAAFGRGTRRAMRDWQTANNHEATGVLTTAQREQLLAQYYAILEGMDFAEVNDARAGIRMDMPLGVVRFDRYESPFAHYDSISSLGARVILISQEGDRNTLNGLYEVLQTLEIVPREGPRKRNRSGFRLTGQDDTIITHAEATLKDGQIKGFMLVWPTYDEERRQRVLARMTRSFTREPGVLESTILGPDTQAVNLVSGLRIRVPRLTRTGFFVSKNGDVVTTADAVAGCGRVTIEQDYEAATIAFDAVSGLAVISPTDGLAPVSFAQIAPGFARPDSEVAVAGFPYGGILDAPTLTYGTISDLRGLSGETTQIRLVIDALPGDAGGAVLDPSGVVVGVLLSSEEATRRPPAGVGLAASAVAIQQLLAQAGLRAQERFGGTYIAPEDLIYRARDLAVVVNCWD